MDVIFESDFLLLFLKYLELHIPNSSWRVIWDKLPEIEEYFDSARIKIFLDSKVYYDFLS